MITITINSNDWTVKVESDSPTFRSFSKKLNMLESGNMVYVSNYVDGLIDMAKSLSAKYQVIGID